MSGLRSSAGGTIALACLDMAGTTVSDSGTVEAAFTAAMAAEGIATDTPRYTDALAYVRATMGQSKIAVFTHLFDGDRTVAERANAAFEAEYRNALAGGLVDALPGAETTLDALRERGIKVCLTTGFSPTTRDAILESLGWAKRVDLVLSPADAGRGRPYPDMILAAVLRLAIDDVAQVAVAGDTASDLLSGHRAGAGIVAGVLSGAHGRAELEAAPHTHLLDTIADLPGILPTADGTHPES
jgi:phosphoglycolate phosphatase